MIEAILNYPAPSNQKQLKEFLGVCNLLQCFVVNDVDYVVPLLKLLRKNTPRKWSAEGQETFETL
jgi:hypothetical protein